MSQPDEIRIRHMVEAADKAVAFSVGRTRANLDSDEMLRLALVKLVEIVGEAAKQVTPEGRRRHPGLAWEEAARMRDRLVHHYFDVNLDVLWATVNDDLPAWSSAGSGCAPPAPSSGRPSTTISPPCWKVSPPPSSDGPGREQARRPQAAVTVGRPARRAYARRDGPATGTATEARMRRRGL